MPPPSLTNTVFLGVGGTTNGLLAVGNQGKIALSPSTVVSVLVTNGVGANRVVTTNWVDLIGSYWKSVPTPTTNDLQGVVATDTLLAACGAKGTILTSTNQGTNWTAVASATSAFLSGLAAFPMGFVTVGDNGTILTSTNGARWVPRISTTTNWLYRVRYLGGQLIAVGENGSLLTSTDGVVWTPRNTGTTRWLNDVTQVTDQRFNLDQASTFKDWTTVESLEFFDATGSLFWITPTSTNDPPARFYRCTVLP